MGLGIVANDLRHMQRQAWQVIQHRSVHPNCRCLVEAIGAVLAGNATIAVAEGADRKLMLAGQLPGSYITKDEAQALGWVSTLGNLAAVAPGKMIGGDVCKNKKQLLPDAPGRIWYEADINYTGGYRKTHRVLYSSDGLVFVTYDHYKTFYEITDLEAIAL
jgi:hypothetical protein